MTVILLLFATSFIFNLFVPHAYASSGASIPQQTAAGTTGPSVPTVTFPISFGSSVAAGEVIVVAIIATDLTLDSVTDTQGLTYTATPPSCFDPVYCAYIDYAASTGGTDTITAKLTGSGTYALDVYVYDVSGVTVSGAGTAMGSAVGTANAATSTSLTFQSGAFLLGVVWTDNSATIAPGAAGFSASPCATCNAGNFAEQSTGGVASSTNFPITFSAREWAEAGLALEPAPSPPPPSIPEYPLGLPLLATLTAIAYAVIKRRTTIETR